MDHFMEEVVVKHNRTFDDILYVLSWIMLVIFGLFGLLMLQSLMYQFCVPALIEALDRPEAQTRWEALDALTALATTCPEQLGDAFEGAETALFDEISSTLRYAAFRLLCVWGATSVERSREAWPILDEAIQCYHGDLEYRDMLGCLYEFGQGEIDAEVAEKLALRLKFDAENGKGSYLKARSSEICEMLVKRFGLDLSKKKKRASVKKSDDAEDEE